MALERDCENGAKSARSLTLGESVFRIGFDIGNLDRLAGKQDQNTNVTWVRNCQVPTPGGRRAGATTTRTHRPARIRC